MILIIIITIHNRNIKEMWEKYISLACYKNTIHMLHSIISKNTYYYHPFPLFWYLWAYWLEWKWKINMKLVERVVRLRPARLFAFSFFPKENSPSSQQYYLNQPQHKKSLSSCLVDIFHFEKNLSSSWSSSLLFTRPNFCCHQEKIKYSKKKGWLYWLWLLWSERRPFKLLLEYTQ